MYTAEIFLKLIHDDVVQDMRNTGILASLTAAQALIESNKGNSGLTQNANNLFGIKGQYSGQSVKMWTTEYVNGVAVRVLADFRKYPSWAESIADHSAMFNRMARYSNLRGCTDYKQACKNVEADGYATAIDPKTGKPNYASTLLKSIETYRLYEWDREGNADMKPSGNPYSPPVALIRKGIKGDGVRWVQYQLNQRGYNLIVDGIFGDLTLGAVLDFQRKNNLVVDGLVGPATRSKLE